MRRVVLAAFILFFAAVGPLFAMRVTSVDDVIRLHRSGVSDELIMTFLHDPFAVTTDDVTAMRDAGLSGALIDAVLAVADTPEGNAPAAAPAPAQAAAETKEASTGDGGWCMTFDPPVVILFPWYWYWGAYSEWLYDPHWYLPRLDSRIAGRPHTSPPAAGGSSGVSRSRGMDARPVQRSGAVVEAFKRVAAEAAAHAVTGH